MKDTQKNEVIEVIETKNEVIEDASCEKAELITSVEAYDKKLAEHRDTLDVLVAEYNNLDDDSTTKAAYLTLQEKIDKAAKAYNDVSLAKLLYRLRGAEDPMKMALTEYSYPNLKVQLRQEGDEVSTVENMTVIPVQRPINLKNLHSRISNFGADRKWLNLCEKFNMLLTMRLTQEVSSKDAAKIVNDTFDICDDSRTIVLEPDVLSQNKMISALQKVINAMLGEGSYKVTSNDTKFIEWRYGKKGKEKLTIKASNMNDFLTTLLNVGHKLVTNSVYKVDYKIKKA